MQLLQARMYSIEKENKANKTGGKGDKFSEMEQKTLREAKIIGD